MMNCPICGFDDIKENEDTCFDCGADLKPFYRLMELPDMLYNKAVRLIKDNRIDEGKQMLSGVLGINPVHVDSLMLLGKVSAEEGKYDEAITTWEKALSRGTGNTDELQELISKARDLNEKALVSKKSDQNKQDPEIKKKEDRGIRLRWLAFSAAIAVIAFVIGKFFQQPIITKNSSKGPSIESVEINNSMNHFVQIANGYGIKVDRNDKGVFCFKGNVLTSHDKYELERRLIKEKKTDSLDLSEVEVTYPKSYFYVVKEGDNLWLIAKKLWGDGTASEKIYEANKKTVSDPHKLYVGQKVLIPE